MTCECTGMEFIANRWVYTGDCRHKKDERVAEAMKRIQRTKTARPKSPAPIDTRTPSGRPLPY